VNVTTTEARPQDGDFGAQLRTARIRRGVTQRQLADLSTVSVRAIRDLETGRAQRPREDTVRLIADGLGLTGRTRTAFEASAGTAGIDAEADGYPGPPPALDSPLGRDRDAAALTELLVSGDQRLVTVVGVGGVGKSRLAQCVAANLHDSRMRVRWLSHDECPDEPTMGTESAVSWSDRPSLLVLDGYEPEPGFARRVSALLSSCPSLRALVTARAPLDVAGERTFPLRPLAVPPAQTGHAGDAAATAGFPAMALLLRSARQFRPDFRPDATGVAALAAVCRRLDGIPAALTAAASWLLVFEPSELLDRVVADPFAIVAPELLGNPLAGVPERPLLDDLSAIDGTWSIAEAGDATGAPLRACLRLVHWLAVRGVVGQDETGDDARFRLLELVRAAYRAGRWHPGKMLAETN